MRFTIPINIKTLSISLVLWHPDRVFLNVFDKVREVFNFSGACMTPNDKFSFVQKHSMLQRKRVDWFIALSPYCQEIVETTSFWSWKSGLEWPKSKNSKIVSRYGIPVVLSKMPKLIEIGPVVSEIFETGFYSWKNRFYF